MASIEWDVIDTGVASAEDNMAYDACLLTSLAHRERPVIHFYDWEMTSATYGLLVKPEEYLNLEAAAERGLFLARRPTGGGIVFHLWDLAFSALVPATCPFFSKNPSDNYALINRAVLRAVKEFLNKGAELELTATDSPVLERACSRFCMAGPTKYDVVIGGRKAAGAAQRRTKGGFLHQGTIALTPPDTSLLTALLPKGSRILEAMIKHTYPLLPPSANAQEVCEAKAHLKNLLTKHLRNRHE